MGSAETGNYGAVTFNLCISQKNSFGFVWCSPYRGINDKLFATSATSNGKFTIIKYYIDSRLLKNFRKWK